MTIEEIKQKANNTKVNLKGYISGIEFIESAKGTKYITGVLTNKGTIPIKVWSGSLYNELVNDSSSGVFDIEATVNIYNEQMSLVINKLTRLDEDMMNYIETPYNVKDLWNRLTGYAKQLSPNGLKVFKALMAGHDFDDNTINSKLFLKSTAAKSHHDSVPCGLAGHTVKILDIITSILDNYPNIKSNMNKDILILGVIFHDIGKVAEYEGLDMSELGKLCSHLSIGIEFLAEHKEVITENIGVEGYYRLHSIITQHHGEFGDRPRTIEAYLIHKADMLESQLTTLNESLKDEQDGVSIKDGNMFLRLR